MTVDSRLQRVIDGPVDDIYAFTATSRYKTRVSPWSYPLRLGRIIYTVARFNYSCLKLLYSQGLDDRVAQPQITIVGTISDKEFTIGLQLFMMINKLYI